MIAELWTTYRELLEVNPFEAAEPALDLYRAGVPAATIAAVTTDENRWDLAYDLVREHSTFPTAAEELLEALIDQGLNINYIDPQSDNNTHLLSLAADSGDPRMVRWLLAHGAYPDLDWAEAGFEAYQPVRDGTMEAATGRAILSALYRAGLSPTVLYAPYVLELYDEAELSLLPLGPGFWRRLGLAPVIVQDLNKTEAALTAALGSTLSGYVQRAL